jgi:hypothetical protein
MSEKCVKKMMPNPVHGFDYFSELRQVIDVLYPI